MTIEVERRLLSVREAATYLGRSPKALYNDVSARRLPFVKIGRSLRFDLRDLEALIEAHRQPASLDCAARKRPHGGGNGDQAE